MTIQFYHDGTSSVSLAEWMNIVPNKTMRNPFLFDRNSPMRFHLHSYQTLPLQHDGCFFGELTPGTCVTMFTLGLPPTFSTVKPRALLNIFSTTAKACPSVARPTACPSEFGPRRWMPRTHGPLYGRYDPPLR